VFLTDVIRDEGRRYRLLKQDLDDLTQDVWVWLLRVGAPARITRPWIRAVVRNFVLRHRRRAFRNAFRERTLGIEVNAPEERLTGGFSTVRMALDQASARLPEAERALLRLVRRGFSFAEAANRLGIPHGSQQYFRAQLLAHLRRELAGRQGPERPDS
jgi:RNA polymerase sigma factor (sigma-70 family)